MTPTEIEKINREFAEKVMGWKLETRQIWTNDAKHYVPTEVYVKGSDKRRFIQASNFDPYHRWDHAAMGLETLRADHPEYYLTLKWPSPTGRNFRFQIKKYSVGCDYYIEKQADTAPAAITLACIEAKKEKE